MSDPARDRLLSCVHTFVQHFGHRCDVCGITHDDVVDGTDTDWCSSCDAFLSEESKYVFEKKYYCEHCYREVSACVP